MIRAKRSRYIEVGRDPEEATPPDETSDSYQVAVLDSILL
jgi:hypothetical protein